MTQTRVDIDATPALLMNDVVVHHAEGALVSGMNGEFLWLDTDMQPVAQVSRPHPMRLRQGVIANGHLIGTWLDRELMLACMGAMPVGSDENGQPRTGRGANGPRNKR